MLFGETSMCLHLASLGQSQKWRLALGFVVKCDLRSLDTAMECSFPECGDVSMALLAARMLSDYIFAPCGCGFDR